MRHSPLLCFWQILKKLRSSTESKPKRQVNAFSIMSSSTHEPCRRERCDKDTTSRAENKINSFIFYPADANERRLPLAPAGGKHVSRIVRENLCRYKKRDLRKGGMAVSNRFWFLPWQGAASRWNGRFLSFFRLQKFINRLAMAQRSESRVKISCTLPSQHAIMKFASYWQSVAWLSTNDTTQC